MFFGMGPATISSDPYQITEVSTTGTLSVGNYDLSGRTQVSATLISSESTCVVIGVGQSNICNSVNSIYTVTQSRNNLYCIYNGGCYASSEPLLGCNTSPVNSGNWLSRLGDQLISTGAYSRVILIPIAIGGTIVADWTSSAGFMNQRIRVIGRRLQASGLRATHVIWHQGESDTGAGTTQASYTNSLASVISTFRSVGILATTASSSATKMFINTVSWFNSVTSSAVTGGQAANVNGIDVIQGGNSDSLNNTYRYDNTHYNSSGAAAMSSLMIPIFQANP